MLQNFGGASDFAFWMLRNVGRSMSAIAQLADVQSQSKYVAKVSKRTFPRLQLLTRSGSRAPRSMREQCHLWLATRLQVVAAGGGRAVFRRHQVTPPIYCQPVTARAFRFDQS